MLGSTEALSWAKEQDKSIVTLGTVLQDKGAQGTLALSGPGVGPATQGLGLGCAQSC